MKNLLLLLISLVFAMGASAQKGVNIPAEAKAGFAAKFSDAQKVKWSIEKPGEFEVEFSLNKAEQSALVDAKGNILETEMEVGMKGLPSAVQKALATDFAGFKFDEIEQATDAKGATTFEMEAVKDRDASHLRLNP